MDLTILKTEKVFNSDTYKCECDTKIISITKDEKDGKIELIFEKTIFHPQGGGQPSDEGFITINNIKFDVLSLNYDREKDIISHKLNTSDEKLFKIGDSTKLNINPEKRSLFARLHSAGHLIDIAVAKKELKLKSGKGFHFPDSPYVEYEGTIEEEKNEDKKKKNDINKYGKIIEELEKICNDLIFSSDEDNNVLAKIYSFEEAKKELILPSYLPEGKYVRWVKILKDELGCPCGGTHVRHINEIGKMKITKIVKKGKNLRICYNLE